MMRTRSIMLAASLAACGAVTGASHGNGPTITSLSPDHGSVIGGTMVTITGSSFGSGTAYVVVGGHLATNVTVASSTTINFVAPAGDQEGATVDVELSTSNGEASKTQSFTYNFKPVVLSITPAGGKIVGGTNITITGRNFMMMGGGAATVQIAGGMATNVTVVDDKTITATTAAAIAGTPAFVPVDVVVGNANGTGMLPTSFSLTKQGLLAIGPTTRCCGASSVTFVDPSDGSNVLLSTSAVHVHACTLSPTTGQLFVIGSPLGVPQVSRTLYTLDPLTGNVTMIGVLQTAASVTKNLGSLAFNNGTLYGTDTGNRQPTGPSRLLVSINPMTAQVTTIGATAMTIANANAIAPDGANDVFVADSITGTLDTINTGTSTRSAGKSMTGGTADSVGGLVNTGTGLFIAGRRTNPNVIYSATIGASSVTLNQVAQLPFGFDGITTMCQTPPSF